MNIKELKAMIEHLPDDMPVVECYSGAISFGTIEPDLFLGKVYKFLSPAPYKGQMQQEEFCETWEGVEVISSYDALIFYTEE